MFVLRTLSFVKYGIDRLDEIARPRISTKSTTSTSRGSITAASESSRSEDGAEVSSQTERKSSVKATNRPATAKTAATGVKSKPRLPESNRATSPTINFQRSTSAVSVDTASNHSLDSTANVDATYIPTKTSGAIPGSSDVVSTAANSGGNDGSPGVRSSLLLLKNKALSRHRRRTGGGAELHPTGADHNDTRQNGTSIVTVALDLRSAGLDDEDNFESDTNQPPTSPKVYRGTTTHASSYVDQLQHMQMDANVPDVQSYQPCAQCGRQFLPGSLMTHMKVCAKVFQHKRKVFDSSLKRAEGIPELQQQLQRQQKQPTLSNQQISQARNPSRGSTDTKNSRWREKSSAFREAMRNARQVTVALKSGAPLPEYVPSGPDPSLKQCPHCQRRFNDKAAERHIPQCQNIIAKPTVLRRGTGINASSPVTKSQQGPGTKKGWQ